MTYRRTRRQDRKRAQESTHCSCMHHTDTGAWHGKRRSGAGLTGQKGANHGNPFKHDTSCIHSELNHTTRPRPNRQTVTRLRFAQC